MTPEIIQLEKERDSLDQKINSLKIEELNKVSIIRLNELKTFLSKKDTKVTIPDNAVGCLLVRNYKDEFPDYYELIEVEFLDIHNKVIKINTDLQTYNRYLEDEKLLLAGFHWTFSDIEEEEFETLFG